ncbi:lamin tail domain-containing protein [Streptomyces sp. Z26]|uniref:lamin tail domain-containing protein n=1 Tax=Streptomyces TaxID=1883 RepID=UPI000EF141A0|nr:lamin tail domain-containing protein [Streptomyces sp. Z26]RLL67289.1 lamin tail domain-containing protein [Streptomyces sp. Z26]
MSRIRTAAVATAAACLAGGVLVPTQAQAAGSVYIYKVYYDSPGSDRGGNSSLNAEYVQIKNSTGAAFQMQGHTLKDASGHKYVFPSYKISAGKTVLVHTGKGTKSAGHLYMGRGWYVWNNDKDKASLYKPGGSLRDSCSYNSTRVDYKMC